MDPDSRVDLFITCHDSEELSPGFTVRALASKTEEAVRRRANNNGTVPFIFVGCMARRVEIADAVLQTRPGGLALFLVTPSFFSNSLCVSTLRAFLHVNSDPNVNMKLRFVCLESTTEDVLSSASVKKLVPNLFDFGRWEDIPVTSIQATSADLCDIVFGAWECIDEFVAADRLPTIVGRTRYESFLVLQRVLTDDDLPMFRALLSLPRTVEHVQDAFMMAGERNDVTQHNLRKLHDSITFRNSPRAEEQRCVVQAYERKWVHSNRLSWGNEAREDLLRFFKNEESGASHASSSSRPQKHLHRTRLDYHQSSESDWRQPRETGDVFKPYFDEPPQWGNVVLDFTSGYGNDNPITAEGQLLRKVLEPFKDNVCGTVSASGSQRSATHGMGGVGKTTALKALCYNDKVKRLFHDGISYLEFGQDAGDRKVIKQLAQCVFEFGGRKQAKEMEESSSLSDVVERGAVWLRDRTVLLICDDLWANSNKYGYLENISKLLQYAPRSRLVISTRDWNIANSAGGIVEFAPLDAEGAKARKILLADFPTLVNVANISDETTNDNLQRILNICAGLPLALAIARHGLNRSVQDSSNNISIGAMLYRRDLEQDNDPIMVDGFDHYPGLARVIDSSLKQCNEWGKSDEVERKYGTLDMNSMFTGLCVLEKQMIMPKRVLKHLWGTDDKCTKKVIEKFADCNLAKRVATGLSTQQEFGLRLHDLVLERCQQKAGNETSKWHKKIVDAYAQKLSGDVKDEEEGENEKIRTWWSAREFGLRLPNFVLEKCQQMVRRECSNLYKKIVDAYAIKLGGDVNDEEDQECKKSRAWWTAPDDGYILANLSRHLVSSNRAGELELLLCDIRWTMLQIKFGGWSPLNSDFEHLFGVQKYASSGMQQVRNVLKKSFPYEREQHGELAFYVFAHLSQVERKETHVAKLLSSIDHHFPKPWLRPANRLVAVRDSREEWKEEFSQPVFHVFGDWKKGTMLVAAHDEISLWSMFDRRPIWSIPYYPSAIAMSRDGKLIASISYDGTIRRWHADSGTQIGDPLIKLENSVDCIAVTEDGKVILSMSEDGRIRRWDAHSGAQLGDSLTEHEGKVCCFATCEDRNVIVTGYIDGTIGLWNTLSGAPIVEPLIGHEDEIYKVLLTTDGNTIVSMSRDGTIRRWDAQHGTQIGDPLDVLEYQVRSFAMSKDPRIILLGLWNGPIQQWDVQTGAQIGDPFIGHKYDVTCIAVSQDGKTILSGSDDLTIRQWHAQSRAQIDDPLIGNEEDVKCSAVIHQESKLSISGAWDGTIPRCKAHSGAQIEYPFSGGKGRELCIALNEDRNVTVLWSDDNTIQRWNPECAAQIGNPLIGHEGVVSSIAVSEEGKTIVSGSWDGTVRRWNAQSGAQIGDPLIGHEGFVTCVACSRDGMIIVSGSRDGTVRRWEFQNEVGISITIIKLEVWVNCIALSGDGGVVVSASKDEKIRRWDRQAQLGASDSSSTLVRSSDSDVVLFSLPLRMNCLAMSLDSQLAVFRLDDNRIGICRMVT